jgi:hypothetical protein
MIIIGPTFCLKTSKGNTITVRIGPLIFMLHIKFDVIFLRKRFVVHEIDICVIQSVHLIKITFQYDVFKETE